VPIPERFRRLFSPELASGEQIRAVSNADLWLRYRRIAITDRRVLVVERGAVRRPRGGRRVTSILLTDIADVTSSASPIATEVVFHTRDGSRHGYAMPTFSRGTKRFASSVRGLVLGDLTPNPSPTRGGESAY
jgi:hypothetical protein